MTCHTTACSYPCEGTSALAPRMRLVLIEGGRADQAGPVAERPARVGSTSALTARQTACALVAGILVILAVVLASVVSDALQGRQAASALAGAATETVVVRPGDSLWSVAAEHAVPGASTSQTLAWIEEANGLEGGPVQAGQTLVVPA